MNTGKLLRLAKISSVLEKKGMTVEADAVISTVVRLANWQSPYMNLPILDRVFPWSMLGPDLDEADVKRQDFQRYKDPESVAVKTEPDEEVNRENSLHPDEANPDAGIINVWYDGASSTQQGRDWGKSMKEHDENKDAGLDYKNLLPNFY